MLYLENFFIYSRLSLDLIVSAWWNYRVERKNLDSLKDFLKKFENCKWYSEDTKESFVEINNSLSGDEWHWIQTLVGASKGQSLRDVAVHRKVVFLDTATSPVDERAKIVLELDKDTVSPVTHILPEIFTGVVHAIQGIRLDILTEERSLANK